MEKGITERQAVMAISPSARLLGGGIHLGGLVGVIGFAYWYAMAFGPSGALVCTILLAVALSTYLIMRYAKRPRSFLTRQLTCAAGIQTLSLLVPVVVVVATILALFDVPGLGWFDSKLAVVTKGPLVGWGLNQVGGLVGGGVVALLAIGAAVRAFRGRDELRSPPAAVSKHTPKQLGWQPVFFLLLIAAVIPGSSVMVGLIHHKYLMALSSLIGLAVVTGSAIFVRGRMLAASKG